MGQNSQIKKMYPILILILCFIGRVTVAQYDANWSSLDSRPLPEWYDKAKIGIFLHWGVYSVPSFYAAPTYGVAWFWYSLINDLNPAHIEFMRKNYKPGFTYQDFAKDFTAEFFDPVEWADLFQKAGAKYVVLTSKHHEGYALWPTKYSFGWNAGDVGPNRDLVGELATAVRDKDLTFGLYYSLYEWFNPLYEEDRNNNWTTTSFVDTKINPQLYEVINTYEPEVLWSDGDWEAPDTYWKSTEFLAWLYNSSPVKDTIVTNDRWGIGVMCNHGDFYSCADRYNPGHLVPHKWENAMTIDRDAWGYRRTLKSTDVLTIDELLETLIQTISYGGNILINVGPTKEGTIASIFQERLLNLGQWLSLNGEGIYETVPWISQNDSLNSQVWYTSKDPNVYAVVLEWPVDNTLSIGAVLEVFQNNANTEVTLLGNEDLDITWRINGDQVDITFPDKAVVNSEWAWVLRIA